MYFILYVLINFLQSLKTSYKTLIAGLQFLLVLGFLHIAKYSVIRSPGTSAKWERQ